MSTASNLGRVQGGGFFGSTSTSTTSILKTDVQTDGVSPLVGDTIVNANGDLCKIDAITSTAYTVAKYGSIRGATGERGEKGERGETGLTGPTGEPGPAGPTEQATSKTLGAIKLGSDITQSASANSPSNKSGRTYPLQLNSQGQGVVNVPWPDPPSIPTTITKKVKVLSSADKYYKLQPVSGDSGRWYLYYSASSSSAYLPLSDVEEGDIISFLGPEVNDQVGHIGVIKNIRQDSIILKSFEVLSLLRGENITSGHSGGSDITQVHQMRIEYSLS